jgi:hypothetical protein
MSFLFFLFGNSNAIEVKLFSLDFDAFSLHQQLTTIITVYELV